jgi:hypothetical protein
MSSTYTPGIGIEVHDDAVKERLLPGYPAP